MKVQDKFFSHFKGLFSYIVFFLGLKNRKFTYMKWTQFECTLVLRYLPVMKEFMTMGSVRLGEMEDLFTDMKSRVTRWRRSVRVDMETTFFIFAKI